AARGADGTEAYRPLRKPTCFSSEGVAPEYRRPASVPATGPTSLPSAGLSGGRALVGSTRRNDSVALARPSVDLGRPGSSAGRRLRAGGRIPVCHRGWQGLGPDCWCPPLSRRAAATPRAGAAPP